MADQADPPPPTAAGLPGLADLHDWTQVMGRAQQMMLEAGLGTAPGTAGGDWWRQGIDLWGRMLAGPAATPDVDAPGASADRRFRGEGWRDPWFDWVRRSYEAAADHLLAGVDAAKGLTPDQREAWRFATRLAVDAMSPAHVAATNPEVIARAVETGGESLLAGLRNLLADLARGQLTHSDPAAFEVGRTLATTPGKVVWRTPLFELIQYAPATEAVLAVPLVIFPPWINRFYILDLTPEKSFVGWCVAQGITVFVVSWRSADASIAGATWDDYVAAQVEAVDTVRALLAVPAAHAIGYCVAGTTLAATLALLAARGEDARIASATFFTAQVDFAGAGDLKHFVEGDQLALIDGLASGGVFDGRYMAAAFNLLRARDLIWPYVTRRYLMGRDPAPFDLLFWNGDTTNLPAGWHRRYLADLYRDNRLVVPGSLSIDGTPIDLTAVTTPAYVQAGRDDHIAPADSVWRITEHLAGPVRFVLAGSGHIAGVVNPPAAGKYQHWLNDGPATTLADFLAGAREVRGSWWPDWLAWLRGHGEGTVPATGARVPGAGALPPLGEAPGEYVRTR